MAASKKFIIGKLHKAALAYDAELNGRSLLFVGVSKDGEVECVEVSFSVRNFQHLTGVIAPGISTRDFYKRCKESRIKESDIRSDTRGWAQLKLAAVPSLFRADLGASMFGESNGSRMFINTDRLVGGVKGALGFIEDESGTLVPNTLLNGDIRPEITNAHRVVAVFRKPSSAPRYEEVVRVAPDANWQVVAASLPDKLAYLSTLVRG